MKIDILINKSNKKILNINGKSDVTVISSNIS